MTSTDSSLVRRFRRGDADAATALYVRYAERLSRLADRRTGQDLRTRFDSDDVVQSVFRTFFRRVAGGAYDVPDGDELWGLLMVITLNKVRHAASRHRAAKRSVGSTEHADSDAIFPPSHDGDQAMRLLRMTIDEYLADLEPNEREILELRVEGYGVAEVAQRCGRTKRTVERVLQRLREGLKAQIDA